MTREEFLKIAYDETRNFNTIGFKFLEQNKIEVL